MKLKDLQGFLHEFLEVDRFDDQSMNGLQVEGREEINRLAFAVSACGEVFRKAVSAGVDALIVHHGLFWKGRDPEPITGMMKDRIKTLLDGECSLFAYHLPIDAHREVGNNFVAASALGLKNLEAFGEYRGIKIGAYGNLDSPISREEFQSKIVDYYGHSALAVEGGNRQVERIGIVSGGAPEEVKDAVELGLDAFVTGESSEPITYYCRENNINFYAMGHYATERVGVRALSQSLANKFNLETIFLEVENEA